MNKRCQFLLLSLFFLCTAFGLSWKDLLDQQAKTNIPNNETANHIFIIDTTLLFQNIVLLNRIEQFIHYLNLYQVQVSNNYELYLLLSNPITREQLEQELSIDTNILILHAELANLLQIDLTEIDAQVLHFSQTNYQNPFTGETINLQILSDSNAERLLQDIGGWMAGNEEELIENFQITIEEIESWISQAKAHQLKNFAQIP